MTPLKAQAIQTALHGDWATAITLNRELLKENPNDVETLNRLGFAYSVIGKTKDAKTTYQKVLELDNQNPIAMKNLKKIKADSTLKSTNENGQSAFSSQLKYYTDVFIEETGKTKVLDLINIAEPKTISHLRNGELVNLCIKRLKIFVLDNQKKYIGMLPDNIGKRLIKFMNGGNYYEAYIKSVDKQRVTIFVKEKKRSNRFKKQPSFLSATSEKNALVIEKNKKPIASQKSKKSIVDADDDGNVYDDSVDESL